MDHESVGRYWDENAEAWTELVRAGYDHFRDGLNTPAFFAMLPDVDGLAGLDVGCGEGHNTRLLAERGARMTGIDISPAFVCHARQAEEAHVLGIRYEVASAVELPFEEASFDFVTAFMSLMDIPETERVLAEIFQVLRPGGFLQFCISHPCFETPHRKTLRDESGRAYARGGRLLSHVERRSGRVALQRRATRGSRGHPPLPRSPLHTDPERVAEPPHRYRFRARTFRRAASER